MALPTVSSTSLAQNATNARNVTTAQSTTNAQNEHTPQHPQIREYHSHPTLFVQGKPFFAYAGEVHNSSASSLAHMAEQVWPHIEGLNMNTLLVPVYWEDIEPEQGSFFFGTVEGLIDQARERGMHLIFLWFGLWKNSESMYVPGWMKKDTSTYPRVQTVRGEKLNIISPTCEAAVERDAHAFRTLMAHIREYDSAYSTVIMVQVENEIGTLGTDRDYSPSASTLFESPVPQALADVLHVSGTWSEAFGQNAAESFMAYLYAQAVECIASAGAEEYPLPLFANAWLRQYPWAAGTYPSGGPVPQVQHIWKATAPTLCAFAPDIYVPYVPDVMDEYAASSPLIIPEVRKDAITASYALYAFAHHRALCYSPFGIEDITLDPDSIPLPPASVMQELNIDPSALDIRNSAGHLAASFALVESLKPLFLDEHVRMHTFVKHSETDFGQFFHLSGYDATVAYAPRRASTPIASGGIIEIDEDTFLLFGMMYSVTFQDPSGVDAKVEILDYAEGSFGLFSFWCVWGVECGVDVCADGLCESSRMQEASESIVFWLSKA